eukprot:gene17934-19723_t
MLPGETPDLQYNEQLPDSLKLSVLDAKSNENKYYRIGKLIEPHRLENFTDKDDRGILDQSFDKDLVWGIAGGLPQPDTGNEEYPQIGSWTAFQKQVSDVKIIKSVINYMPTIDAPPEYNVCKDYLDSMVDVMELLDAPHIFVHADEQVYARVLHLMWKHKEEYKNIIPILGGFHQLGEGFDALIQNRVEDITSNYASMDKDLKGKVIELRKNPSPETPPLTSNGWKIIEESLVSPIWFVGEQLPPSLTTKCTTRKPKRSKASIEEVSEDSSASSTKKKKFSKSSSLPCQKRWERLVMDAATSHAKSIENSSCEASEDDEEWEHLSDFLSDSSDSDNSGSDWTPF